MDQEELGQMMEDLISKIMIYNPHVHYKIIKDALRLSAKVHQDRKRESGEDHFLHAYEIGHILADLKLDSHTIAAGITHDVLEYGVRPETVAKDLDDETLSLIQSITKLKMIDRQLSYEEEQARRAENLRKIILATAKDVRVILIKLADRLHNMRTLKYLPDDKRRIIAQETMDIYAPISHKLGMYNMKAELEDLAFRFLEPKIYQDIKAKVNAKKIQREKEVARVILLVKKMLKDEGIESEVYGRVKSFYSIYKKIVGENKHFDEIYDLIAIRIITEDVHDCYKALGIIHTLWKPMPGRLKDYIATPKSNGYQSLHTGVFIGPGKVLEVQIRDRVMHRAAEEGIASHWRYKGDEQDKRFDRQLEWLKQLLEWKRTEDAQEFIESLKIDLFQREIFVFTPKGDPIALPEEATVVDFAFAVHTDIGLHCKQAKVNGLIVPLDHMLNPGDVIEILTVKNITVSRSWLGFVKSSHTKQKIKHALHMEMDTRRRKDIAEPEAVESEHDVTIENKRYVLKVPRCCSPRLSDDIRAFRTKEGKVVIHKTGCINIHSCDPSKEMKLDLHIDTQEIDVLRIDVNDRIGVLSEILSFIAKQGHNVKSLNTRFGRDGRVLISIEIVKPRDIDRSALIKNIKGIDSVINAYIEE
jgi:GTP diphosphokinase / guanosine-3',5'-bis(diphosphate) 3'-diphosphatase